MPSPARQAWNDICIRRSVGASPARVFGNVPRAAIRFAASMTDGVHLEPQLLPWEAAGWFERVESWVGIELGRLGLEPQGKLELVRTRPWAAVARIATTAGDVWFKEPAPSLAFEPALTVAVSRRMPAFTPEVLVTEGTWMLTRDAGPQLRAVVQSRRASTVLG